MQTRPGQSVRPTRRSLSRSALHPAWLEAIPASIDDLQGAAAPFEPDLHSAVRATVVLGKRHQTPRFALPRGRWPWWAWATYASTIGTASLASLYAVAVARLALPKDQRLWVYRTREGAAKFIVASSTLVLVASAAFTVVPPSGRPAPFGEPSASLKFMNLASAGSESARDPGRRIEQSAPSDADAPPSTGEAPEANADPVASILLMWADVAPVALFDVAAVSEARTPIDATPTVDANSAVTAPLTPELLASVQVNGRAPLTSRVIVANTGGRGVAFRNSARWDDRVAPKVAVREGTSLAVIEPNLLGDDGSGGTTGWLRVRDGQGRTGYVPSRFVRAP